MHGRIQRRSPEQYGRRTRVEGRGCRGNLRSVRRAAADAADLEQPGGAVAVPGFIILLDRAEARRHTALIDTHLPLPHRNKVCGLLALCDANLYAAPYCHPGSCASASGAHAAGAVCERRRDCDARPLAQETCMIQAQLASDPFLARWKTIQATHNSGLRVPSFGAGRSSRSAWKGST